MDPIATIVASSPRRHVAALPNSTMWSSGTSAVIASNRFASKWTTGLLSRIALRSRPNASAGFDGAVIFRPGTWASIAYMLCECWAADRWPPM